MPRLVSISRRKGIFPSSKLGTVGITGKTNMAANEASGVPNMAVFTGTGKSSGKEQQVAPRATIAHLRTNKYFRIVLK